MRKFDPIDIFFIALISAYFITLFCIGITFLYIKLTKNKRNVMQEEGKVEDIPVKREKNMVKPKLKKEFNFDLAALKKKIVSLPLIRVLFMKEVKPKRVDTKELEPVKIKVEPLETLADTEAEEVAIVQEDIKEKQEEKDEKTTSSPKKVINTKTSNNKSNKSGNIAKKSNTTGKTGSKKTSSSSKSKSTSAKSTSTKKKSAHKKTSSKSGTRKSTKKSGTANKSTTNKKKRSTKRAK